MFGTLRSSASAATIILAAGLTASPLVVPAHADGLKPPASPPAAQVMWNGFYLGTHMGAGEGHWSGTFNRNSGQDSAVLIERLNTNGLLGGVHAGFNWDRGRYVFGIEGDISAMDWKDVAKAPSGSEEVTGEIDLLASIRGRLGVAIGEERRFLLYGTAGVAFADAEAVVYDSGEADVQGGVGYDIGAVGAVIGTGFEWAATDRFRIRAEGLYYWFGDSSNITRPLSDFPAFPNGGADPGDYVEFDNAFSVRIGASWYMNGEERSTYKPASFAPASAAGAQAIWNGFYLGTHMGVGEAHWDGIFNGSSLQDSAVLIDRLNTKGLLGGAHAGFNWDRGRYVLGIEGDISGMDWEDVAKAPSGSEEVTGELDLLASIRGRLGVTVGDDRRFLLYGTAGVAFSNAEAVVYDSGQADAQGGFAHDVGSVGGVFGTGFEWAATDRFRIRAEGLYYLFHDDSTINQPPEPRDGGADPGDSAEFRDAFVVRLGGSWRFNGPR